MKLTSQVLIGYYQVSSQISFVFSDALESALDACSESKLMQNSRNFSRWNYFFATRSPTYFFGSVINLVSSKLRVCVSLQTGITKSDFRWTSPSFPDKKTWKFQSRNDFVADRNDDDFLDVWDVFDAKFSCRARRTRPSQNWVQLKNIWRLNLRYETRSITHKCLLIYFRDPAYSTPALTKSFKDLLWLSLLRNI